MSETTNIRSLAIAFLAGLIFAAGLTLGGMMDPRKVQGFLDIGALFGWGGGKWDPSLAFVMGGALVVSLIAFGTVKSHHVPWVSARFELPTRRDIDAKLGRCDPVRRRLGYRWLLPRPRAGEPVHWWNGHPVVSRRDAAGYACRKEVVLLN